MKLMIAGGFAQAAADVPQGMILMFEGTSLPDGYVFCDGTNGTPDLRNKFVVGAGSSYAVANTGGEVTNSLASHYHYIGPHAHNVSFTTGGGSGTTGSTTATGGSGPNPPTHTHTGSGYLAANQTNSGYNDAAMNIANEPPYYTLAYIMKA